MTLQRTNTQGRTAIAETGLARRGRGLASTSVGVNYRFVKQLPGSCLDSLIPALGCVGGDMPNKQI